jgi:hypothetical protein
VCRVLCVVCRVSCCVVSCRVSRVVWALGLCASTIHVDCFFLGAPLRHLPPIGNFACVASPRASRVVTLNMFCFPQASGPVTLSRAQAWVAIWAQAGWPLDASLGWANQGGCSRVTVPPAVETSMATPPVAVCLCWPTMLCAGAHTTPCHGRAMVVGAGRARAGRRSGRCWPLEGSRVGG